MVIGVPPGAQSDTAVPVRVWLNSEVVCLGRAVAQGECGTSGLTNKSVQVFHQTSEASMMYRRFSVFISSKMKHTGRPRNNLPDSEFKMQNLAVLFELASWLASVEDPRQSELQVGREMIRDATRGE